MKEPLFSSLSKPVRLVLYYFMGVIGLSFLGAFLLHYVHWGYWLQRPGVLDAAKTIVEVEQLVKVETLDCQTSEQCSFFVYSGAPPSELLNQPYFNDLYKRLPRYLQAQGKLPSSFDNELQGVSDLYTPLMQSPIIATPDQGFSNHRMEGIVVVGKTSTGEQRAFISAIGEPIADEYAPYYEAIFKIGMNGESVQYLKGQRFFFDTDMNESALTVFTVILLVMIFGCIPTILVIIIDTFWSYRNVVVEERV